MDKNPSAKVAAKTAKRRMKQRVVVAGRRMKYQIVQDKEKHEAEMNYKFKVTKAEQQQLRERVEKEGQLTKVNMARITNSWRNIMRTAKVDGLLHEIRILEQTHRRDVDRRDAVLQMLDRDIEEADEQYLVIVRATLSDIDKLLEVQDTKLIALESDFMNELDGIVERYQETMEKAIQSHEATVFEMRHIFQAIRNEEEDKLREIQSERESQREEVNSANLERVHYLQSVLDNRIEQLEHAFENAHANYMASTDQRTQDYKALMARGQKISTGVDMKQKRIRALKREVHKWRVRLTNTKREEEEKNNNLWREKEDMRKHFQVLKDRMDKRGVASEERLAKLAKEALQTKNKLIGDCRIAECILQKAEHARELESNQELILPQSLNENFEETRRAAIPEETRHELQHIKEQLGDTGAVLDITETDDKIPEIGYLDGFFRRYNNAMVQNILVETERDRLRNENEALQSLIRQFLDGVTISESTLRHPNSLMVVNGADDVEIMPVRAINNQTVVEANHMVGTGRLTPN